MADPGIKIRETGQTIDLKDVVLTHHAGGVACFLQQFGQSRFPGQNVGIELHHGLTLSFGPLEKVSILGTAREFAGQDIKAAGRADGGSDVLLRHQGAFPDQTVYVGGQIAALPLGKAVEMLGQHIIGDKEDDIGRAGVLSPE